MGDFCYLAEVCWHWNEEKNKTHNCIIYADTYADAMKIVLKYYSDEDIDNIKLTCLNDCLFCIPDNRIDELSKFQTEVF